MENKQELMKNLLNLYEQLEVVKTYGATESTKSIIESYIHKKEALLKDLL